MTNNKIYCVIKGDTLNDIATLESDGNLTIDRNAIVNFNLRAVTDTNNRIIKIDIVYDYNQQNVLPDETYSYNDNLTLRGNMLRRLKADNNSTIPVIYEHYYTKKQFNTNEYDYITQFRFHTINGDIYIKNIYIRFNTFAFMDAIGNINLLNAQFIDNDYNHLFVIAETDKKDIIQFCLKQIANRGQAISSGDPVIQEPIEGEIVTINDHDIYICTIDSLYPLYLIDNSMPLTNDILTIKTNENVKIIKTNENIISLKI